MTKQGFATDVASDGWLGAVASVKRRRTEFEDRLIVNRSEDTRSIL